MHSGAAGCSVIWLADSLAPLRNNAGRCDCQIKGDRGGGECPVCLRCEECGGWGVIQCEMGRGGGGGRLVVQYVPVRDREVGFPFLMQPVCVF